MFAIVVEVVIVIAAAVVSAASAVIPAGVPVVVLHIVAGIVAVEFAFPIVAVSEFAVPAVFLVLSFFLEVVHRFVVVVLVYFVPVVAPTTEVSLLLVVVLIVAISPALRPVTIIAAFPVAIIFFTVYTMVFANDAHVMFPYIIKEGISNVVIVIVVIVNFVPTLLPVAALAALPILLVVVSSSPTYVPVAIPVAIVAVVEVVVVNVAFKHVCFLNIVNNVKVCCRESCSTAVATVSLLVAQLLVAYKSTSVARNV